MENRTLARKIYKALNEKGANLDITSIAVIHNALETEKTEALHESITNGVFDIKDMEDSFISGQKSKEPKLEYERWGDMDAFASSEITYSFADWINKNWFKL